VIVLCTEEQRITGRKKRGHGYEILICYEIPAGGSVFTDAEIQR
jgi:hypothetical protein